jgi:hypothetical protein
MILYVGVRNEQKNIGITQLTQLFYRATHCKNCDLCSTDKGKFIFFENRYPIFVPDFLLLSTGIIPICRFIMDDC